MTSVLMNPQDVDRSAARLRNALHVDLEAALAVADPAAVAALAHRIPADRHDAALTLAAIHDLHLAPVFELGEAVRLQHHPAVAVLKTRIEEDLQARLVAADEDLDWSLPDDAVAALRAIAARDRVPVLYRWVAETAGRDDLLGYLAVEGGPDGGFDDLVALCQIGLDGPAKLELGTNYWDEMGAGDAIRVHTELHRKFVGAVDLPVPTRNRLPTEALERTLLGSMLATNRALQPELIGALGLIEMQAGPRCRQVLAGLDRLGFGHDARDFYDEHAVTDPRHGKDWLDNVIAPLAADPRWAPGIVRGARWRWIVNNRLFAAMTTRFVPGGDKGARP